MTTPSPTRPTTASNSTSTVVLQADPPPKPHSLTVDRSRFDVVYAQITVLDALKGDSNVVDINCTSTPGGSCDFKEDESWRMLIDTGPSFPVNSRSLQLMKKVLTEVGLPNVNAAVPVVPKLNMVQITHIDDDHAGNATPLLKMVRSSPNLREQFKDTCFAFHEFLGTYPFFVLTIGSQGSREVQCIPDYSDTEFDTQLWLDGIRQNGLIPSYSWSQDYIISGTQAKDLPSSVYKIGPRPSGSTHPLPQFWETTDSWKYKVPDPPAGGNNYGWVNVTCIIRIKQFRKLHQSKVIDEEYLCVQKPGPKNQPKNPDEVFEIEVSNVFQLDPTDFSLKTEPRVKDTQPPTRPLLSKGSQVAVFMRLRQEIKALRRSHKAQVSDRVMRPVHGQLVLPKELQKNFTVKIAGPMDKVYKELIQTAFRIGIRNHGNENHEHVDWDLKEADLANRASVITFFESPKKDFTMLFTGDAHDKHCAIRDTIAAWLPADKRPMWFFDVLKVPHHGSNVTADLEFYQTVKARVYLVCARQTDHGSPSYDTLKTIVSSIKYTGDNQNAPGPLHYLFFTNPDTLEPLNPGTEGEKKFSSNVTLLLTGDYRPNEARKPVPGRQEIYHYKCYRLKKAQGGQQLTAGRILLGKKNGELALDFKVAANDQDPDGEWVEITVADAEQKWWDVQHANESA